MCPSLLDYNYFQILSRCKKSRVIQLALQWAYRPALSRAPLLSHFLCAIGKYFSLNLRTHYRKSFLSLCRHTVYIIRVYIVPPQRSLSHDMRARCVSTLGVRSTNLSYAKCRMKGISSGIQKIGENGENASFSGIFKMKSRITRKK